MNVNRHDKKVVMKKLVLSIFFLSLSCLQAKQQNLILLVDINQQEGIKKDEITATHQLITALQQQAAPILVSTSLWKNVCDRKQEFTKRLDDTSSLEFQIRSLYQATNKQFQACHYDLDAINQKLSISWYKKNYPKLALLEQSQLDQLKFNFLCYNFDYHHNQWSLFNAQTGMLLFIPQFVDLYINHVYKVHNESDITYHKEKQSHVVVQSLQLLLGNNYDEWVIYLSGHGNPQNRKEVAHIAGMPLHEFSDLLAYLHKKMRVKLLVYSSCYAGGVHTVEPYKNMKLHFPIMTVALMDAPIYGFGFFEGVKLPPYNQELYLTSQDVQHGAGLLVSQVQQFQQFFQYAWSGQFDMNLIETVSQFFTCDNKQCMVKKIENMPLIRKAHGVSFHVVQDDISSQFMYQAKTSQAITTQKPVLLYIKKIDKITLTSPVAIVSMLPGLQNHEIKELVAEKIPLSQLMNETFLSVADAEKNKNYLIDRLVCQNDLIASAANKEITHCMIIQQDFVPKFLSGKPETFISFQSDDAWYLVIWKHQKAEKIMRLTDDQIDIMIELEKFLQQGIDFQDDVGSHTLVTFDAYVKNKMYQHDIIESCLRDKICKKW